ncbi:40s ribosomal protein s10 [Coprinopsis cinerea okayama7|uniref:40s ribosomal protein s10 n=1 Tax=Coprinopsis cinerea (strain Okayama-7 / 130 / ATCC MYA-4618 / FGSC 9003) TaxID=240176 RepID=A8P378_COPC7|nr:40s ribosomal protein s10 [Coprinopsis cinerea okayama7\|eukprot:XP_001838488.2 40s ribosomal protein s10 [Coprinopsis cinerea okayama7\
MPSLSDWPLSSTHSRPESEGLTVDDEDKSNQRHDRRTFILRHQHASAKTEPPRAFDTQKNTAKVPRRRRQALPVQPTNPLNSSHNESKMIISKPNRRIIYENLFKEGVLVAKKDFNAPKHEELDVPNLEVIKAMQSLTSKGYVKTRFSWQWYYYVLTPEGVEFLREWLHLPAEIVPATHKKAVRPPRPAQVRTGGDGAYRAPRGDREDYRKKEGAPGDFRPQFAGVGRGAPRE